MAPIRISWNPIPEWFIKGGASINYTKPRGGGGYNHYSNGLVFKVEYKPFKFIEQLIPIGTLSDFTISFTKSYSNRIDGWTNEVMHLPQSSFERIGMGWNMEF